MLCIASALKRIRVRRAPQNAKIGYVANSAHTVIGESMSAGRIYDKIGDTAKAKIVLVTPNGTICSLNKKKVTYE